MTLVSTNALIAIPPIPKGASGAPTPGNAVLNALDDAVANIYQSPVTDTITKIGFMLGLLTGDCDLEVRIETVSAGLPSGTLWGTNTSVTVSLTDTVDDLTYKEVTLTSPASVTRGDIFAVVINHVENDTVSATVMYGILDDSNGLPYTAQRNPSPTWNASVATAPTFCVHFGTNGYYPLRHSYPVEQVTTSTFSGATLLFDHAGNKFNLPYKCEAEGFWLWADFDADANIELLDSAGNVIATSAIYDDVPAATGQSVNSYYFDSNVTLNAGEDYYLVIIEPSANMSVYTFDFNSSSMKGQYCSDDVQLISAKDPAGIGDYTVSTTRVMAMGLLISQLDDGSSGSTGLAANPIGGFIG